MTSIYRKFMGVFFLLALIVLFLPLQGCPETVVDQLIEGAVYEVELQVNGDGTFYALEIGVADTEEDGDNDEQEGDNQDGDQDEEGDGDQDEDEDGDDVEQEGDHQDGDDDENDDENEDVEFGFSVQVDSVASDCSSFTVFGGLVVLLEDEENEDEDEEGDVEEEEGDQRRDEEEVADEDDDELAVCDLSAGMWIEVEGEFGTDGFFHAEDIEAADDEDTEMVGTIQNLTDTTFTIFGVTINYDDATEMDLAGDDEDGDDVECEQEGENEGENEGC